jgi:Flp pilus assembly protein TadG
MKRPISVRLRHLRDDERGMALVYMAVGFMTFMAASTLAIDVGMFMTARSQAQNSADAGALAGAVALARNDWDDRTATGPAVQGAISTAKKNVVIGTAPSVLTTDVTFPNDPAGNPTRVHVKVYRTTGRDTAVKTLIGPLFGIPTVDIAASATAEVSPANAMTCVKPFMIPDKWVENVDKSGNPTGTWSPTSEYNAFDKQGVPMPNPDVYRGANDPAYTGYTVANDVGKQLVLRAGTGDGINPSFYYSWKMPGDTGGDFYRQNIANCNTSLMTWGDLITQEPGAMSGPTIQGIDDLIAKDPTAQWDTSCNCVINSKFGDSGSPRIFPIPLYDPGYYATGKANGRVADFRIANFLGFFVTHTGGNAIHGYVTNIVGVVKADAETAPANAFPKAIRLVQ